MRTGRKAFTLAESLAASVILAVAVVGVSGALIASQQQSGAQRRTHVLTMLAQQMMERVSAMPFQKADGTTGVAGWPASGDISLYDTLDDFNGYTDTVDVSASLESSTTTANALTSSGPEPKTLTSVQAVAAGPRACQRTVTITYPTVLFGISVQAGDWAVVQVTVRAATGESLTLSKTVCNYAAARSG